MVRFLGTEYVLQGSTNKWFSKPGEFWRDSKCSELLLSSIYTLMENCRWRKTERERRHCSRSDFDLAVPGLPCPYTPNEVPSCCLVRVSLVILPVSPSGSGQLFSQLFSSLMAATRPLLVVLSCGRLLYK